MRVHEYDVFLNEKRIPYLKEIRDTELTDTDCLCSPRAVGDTVRRLYYAEQLPEEHVWLLVLDAKNHMIGTFEISRGSYNQTAIIPAQIIQRALLCGAMGMVLVHNHPSGDPTPSEEDRLITIRIKHAAELCGIELVDHVIVAGAWKNQFYSFKEQQVL